MCEQQLTVRTTLVANNKAAALEILLRVKQSLHSQVDRATPVIPTNYD